MFSFHKPKIYRSALGCCICRAKSSSSRFTDSKKYEPEFARCFRIVDDKRSGEICNACVLLVKRWKKLPPGTTRDWHHVVDARAGPGTKSVNKGKVKSPKRPLKKHRLTAEKRCKLDLGGGALSDDITIGDDSLSESSNLSPPESRAASPTPSNSSEDSGILDEEDDDDQGSSQRCSKKAKKKKLKQRGSGRQDRYNSQQQRSRDRAASFKISSFLDMSFWRKEKVCCGIIFKGPHGEVLIYPKLLRPCRCRRLNSNRPSSPSNNVDPQTPTSMTATAATKVGPMSTSATGGADVAAALLFPTPEVSDSNLSSPEGFAGGTSPYGSGD
ncbi:SIN3-HDAC complex-associated factor-like [Ornithodoros turicata]|uniref:SIN3-HDAC complex-associated factor-like n=1 Tax=Ornithodoros turicata TaxID=34597 RepID=UPI0031398DB5